MAVAIAAKSGHGKWLGVSASPCWREADGNHDVSDDRQTQRGRSSVDNNGMRTSLSWLLESVGIRPVGFVNPAESLRHFDARVPACLVLDVRMPQAGGFDVQAGLQRQGATLPITFVSGHGDIPMSVRALQNGAIDLSRNRMSEPDPRCAGFRRCS